MGNNNVDNNGYITETSRQETIEESKIKINHVNLILNFLV